MRLVTYLVDGERRVGTLRDREVVDLNRADATLPIDVVALLEAGAATLERARRAVASAAAESAAVQSLEAVKLLAPIPRPPKIVCVGLNYADHVAEAAAHGRPPMEKPSVFVKVSSAVIGPGEPIVRPTTTQQLHYVGGLAERTRPRGQSGQRGQGNG